MVIDKAAPLVGYRVLDLTDEKGLLCGKVLGDLGCDVIKVEPPGGSPARSIGPFFHDIPHPEKSLYWFAYNNNKRGVTLNIERAEGRAILHRLVKSADFVIESFAPGYLESIGLGYSVLRETNLRVILTSITPFGQTGPYRDYKSSDIVITALNGFLYLCGDPDRPPVRISFPQAYLHASIQAAVGTMVAHYYRELSGVGQWVDTSAQASLVYATMDAPLYWEAVGTISRREGANRYRPVTGAVVKVCWHCKNGYVVFVVMGGSIGAGSMQNLAKWMDSEGMSTEYLRNMDWEALDFEKLGPADLNRIQDPIQKFFLTKTTDELLNGALERRIILYPCYTVKDISGSLQLSERGFWVEIDHPEVGAKIKYPGVFAKASETPLRIGRRAPLIGEHNEEIYGDELGFSKEDLIFLKQAGVI
jgi:crotonobetainyl-CoA:carnitine CoA-transferase CaiB-like acyl-CoA transferase